MHVYELNTPTPRASIQARPVLQIVPPSSPIFGELKPASAESAGCPGVSIDRSNELVAIDKSGDGLQLGPAFLTETDVSRAEATQIGFPEGIPCRRRRLMFISAVAGPRQLERVQQVEVSR
jgi:hypothetical protein